MLTVILQLPNPVPYLFAYTATVCCAVELWHSVETWLETHIGPYQTHWIAYKTGQQIPEDVITYRVSFKTRDHHTLFSLIWCSADLT